MRQKQRGCDGARRAAMRTAITSGTPATTSTVLATIGALALAAAGCGSGSNSEVSGGGSGGATGNPDGGGAAGTPGGAAGSTGAAGNAGIGTGGASGAGTGGASGGGTGGSAGGCPALPGFSQAEHIVMNVTWPNTIGTSGGTGQVHVWAKTTFTASGNDLTATSQACGSLLPPTGLNLLAGGGSVLIQIPDATWDLPSMPRFQFTATQTGWSAGSTINYTSTALIGLTLTNPATDAWPGAITTAVDADNDTKTGYTAVPATAGGRVLPPTSLNTTTNRADRVYLATRNVFMVTATRNACDHAAGPVTVVHFDSHVVGCHVSGGAECTTAQSNFVDQNRTIYEAGASTIELKAVPATATCADVRAALPMM
jgi:hypothetical protein